jgi:uncharacterized YceG family protein
MNNAQLTRPNFGKLVLRENSNFDETYLSDFVHNTEVLKFVKYFDDCGIDVEVDGHGKSGMALYGKDKNGNEKFFYGLYGSKDQLKDFKAMNVVNEIIKTAKQAMEKALNEAYKNLKPNSPIKTKNDILILASIIEKETGIKTERELVSSVFTNRLKIGMRLQTDPTVIYAVTNGKMNLERALLKKDLTYDSPYNTYVYNGLPPTPICSPGIDAINAATNPSDTKYLYFVADGKTGGHRFATNLKEHNKNVALYRKERK